MRYIRHHGIAGDLHCAEISEVFSEMSNGIFLAGQGFAPVRLIIIDYHRGYVLKSCLFQVWPYGLAERNLTMPFFQELPCIGLFLRMR